MGLVQQGNIACIKKFYSSMVQLWITTVREGDGTSLPRVCVMQMNVQVLRRVVQSCYVAVPCGSIQHAVSVSSK